MTLKEHITRGVTRLAGNTARVIANQRVGERLALIEFELLQEVGDRLNPGDKLKVHVGEGAMRSYTPFGWSHHPVSSAKMLVHLHGAGAGSRWGARVEPGELFEFFGPARSFVPGVTDELSWALFYGDETALGLAAALTESLPDTVEVLGAVEVASGDIGGPAAIDLSLATLERGAAREHGEALLGHLASLKLPDTPGVIWLSGETDSILALRRALLERGVDRSMLRIKPYWAVAGKAYRKSKERSVLHAP